MLGKVPHEVGPDAGVLVPELDTGRRDAGRAGGLENARRCLLRYRPSRPRRRGNRRLLIDILDAGLLAQFGDAQPRRESACPVVRTPRDRAEARARAGSCATRAG
jgi:hypothetical protein